LQPSFSIGIMNIFKKFVDLVKKLRSPQGCPWDREQTFESLTPYIIEEAYELVSAINQKCFKGMEEELGDILLHVVMISNMAEETGEFKLEDVINNISEKMIRRHPHVFSNTEVNSVKDVLTNWDEIKKIEKKTKRILDKVPKYYPALLKAEKIQQEVAKVGFDWPDIKGPIAKVFEEAKELRKVVNETPLDKKQLKMEYGDLLFSIVNVGRKLGINPEESLQLSNQKFTKRFNKIEPQIKESNNHTLESLDKLWEQAKLEH
jgi:tetrapyrrole methylase family protein / MazG family protein